MKTLTLLRHAKSSWDDSVTRDFERPLNGKGRRAAATMGRFMASANLSFDIVLASPAARVRQTIDGVEDGMGAKLAPVFDARIYMASAVTLLDLVQAVPAAAERVLMIGHNPGLEELVLLLTPEGEGLRCEVKEKYPTASLAQMTVAGAWAELAAGGAVLTRFTRPRELDPSLGPDPDE